MIETMFLWTDTTVWLKKTKAVFALLQSTFRRDGDIAA